MISSEYQQFKAATKAHELQQTEDGKRVEIRQLDHEFQCQVNQQFDHAVQPLDRHSLKTISLARQSLAKEKIIATSQKKTSPYAERF